MKNRLESWGKEAKIQFPKDILKIRAAIPELQGYSDAQIQDMYSYWGEYYYCAGWLIVGDGVIEEFKDWLLGFEHYDDDRSEE